MDAWSKCAGVVVSAMMLVFTSSKLSAETMESALARAYRDNPQLNAQRAAVRVTDEYVPQALSGYRPKIGVITSVGEQYSQETEVTPVPGAPPITTALSGAQLPYGYGISASQTLFNGFQNANRTRAAESQVSAAREGLRVIEQNILLSAATVYMDVLRDSGDVEIQRNYVDALRKVVQQTKVRFSRGDVTQTDVSQTETQLAGAENSLLIAEATLASSRANYEAIIGIPPHDLHPGAPVDGLAPPALLAAINVAMIQNPNMTAAMYGIDVAYLQVKINEGALFPTLTLQGVVQQNTAPALGVSQEFVAGLTGQLSVPIYQGGAEYSLIRQSKETLGQQRLTLDQMRRQTRAAVAQAWAQVEATKGEVRKAREQVAAAEAAVNGMLKEIRVGERTTLDLLINEQYLVTARTSLLTAQHDRVVSSYTLLSAVGRLLPDVLHLPTEIYDPQVHYQQVRDAWAGVRTPDGQ
jgi:outer membrane protein